MIKNCLILIIAIAFNHHCHSQSSNNTTSEHYYCIRLYVHLVDDNSGIYPINKVYSAIDILNEDFNPHNINFVIHDIDTVTVTVPNDNCNYKDHEPEIFDCFYHEDGMDLYLFNQACTMRGGASEGFVKSALYVCDNSPPNSINSRLISHEMGHALYLHHPHHGTAEGGADNPCPELVDGSNSTTCGDYVQDTPADPNLLNEVDHETCVWNGDAPTDANGDHYNPDTKLIMSYSPNSCRKYFSSGQGERMRNALENHDVIKEVVINDCSFICPENLATKRPLSNGREFSMSAQNMLNATNKITNNTTVQLVAGNKIYLDLGFSVEKGSDFSADLGSCMSSKSLNNLEHDKKKKLVKNTKTISMEIYPNPANTHITIETKHAISEEYQIVVYNINGCTVKNYLINKQVSTFDINEFSNGSYFIKLQNNGKTYDIQKLMVIK